MGLFRAVDGACERVLSPALASSAVGGAAPGVPREATRKAPVRREVVDAVAAAFPGFPTHRVSEVLDAVAAGKAPGGAARPPDAAVVLAFLALRWTAAGGFGDRALPLGPLSDDDVRAAVRDVVALAELRQALERGRDPGEGWPARLEQAAFGLLRRLASTAPSVG
jgi:hypothetical protein